MEDGGARDCRGVLLGTLLAACNNIAAEPGILDVVAALRRALLGRRDFAEFLAVARTAFLDFLVAPLDCVGSVSVCLSTGLLPFVLGMWALVVSECGVCRSRRVGSVGS